MNKQIKCVEEFHRIYKLGNSEKPIGKLENQKENLRFELMKEENDEYLEAAKNGDIVGRVEYNSRRAAEEGFYPSFEGKDGATKYLFGYEAFFDATKQPK